MVIILKKETIIYRGEWSDENHLFDDCGASFRPSLTVTEEINGCLVWMETPNGYASPEYFQSRSSAIENAVKRVLKHRAESKAE